MKVSILGCGRWGSFLAWYSNKVGHDTISYGPNDTTYKNLLATRKNEFVVLDDKIQLTANLKEAVDFADIIIVSIDAQNLRGFLKEVCKHNLTNKKIILCMKGIEIVTGKRLTEVAIECGVDKNQVAVWVGPGHIQDFVKNIPNCMVMDSYSPALTRVLVDYFTSDLIHFYYGTDIIGTEIGAATKNIFGLLAGMLDGAGLGALKGALMARGALEVSKLIKKLGGRELSAYGLCHLGDYEATLFSKHSNNRLWGELYMKNKPFKKLAEGVHTARAVHFLAVRHGVDMPLTSTVDALVTQGKPPKNIWNILFNKVSKAEF